MQTGLPRGGGVAHEPRRRREVEGHVFVQNHDRPDVPGKHTKAQAVEAVRVPILQARVQQQRRAGRSLGREEGRVESSGVLRVQEDVLAETVPEVSPEVPLREDHVHLRHLHEEVHENRQSVEAQRVPREPGQILVHLLREDVRQEGSVEQASQVPRQQVPFLLRDMPEILQGAALIGQSQKELSLGDRISM